MDPDRGKALSTDAVSTTDPEHTMAVNIESASSSGPGMNSPAEVVPITKTYRPTFVDEIDLDSQAGPSVPVAKNAETQYATATLSSDLGSTKIASTSTLHDIIKSGDEDALRSLLKSYPYLMTDMEKDGSLALHYAVEEGRESLVALLLDHGANTETVDKTGRTALHQAVRKGNLEITRLLHQNGANIEATSEIGEKPLWIAASCGKEDIARFLLEVEADPESLNTHTNTTALFEAVKRDSISLAKILLDHGADVDASPHVGTRNQLQSNHLQIRMDSDTGLRDRFPERLPPVMETPGKANMQTI